MAQKVESARNAGDPGSILGLGRSPGEGNGNPLQYSCLENPMEGGAGGLQSMGSQSQTRLSDFTFTFHFVNLEGWDGEGEEMVVQEGGDIYMSSVQFSRSVVCDSLQPHESQPTRPPCPSPTPGVYSNSGPS